MVGDECASFFELIFKEEAIVQWCMGESYIRGILSLKIPITTYI